MSTTYATHRHGTQESQLPVNPEFSPTESAPMKNPKDSIFYPIQVMMDQHPYVLMVVRFMWFKIFHLPSPMWGQWLYDFLSTPRDYKHLHYAPKEKGAYPRTPSRMINAFLWIWYTFFAPTQLPADQFQTEEQKRIAHEIHKKHRIQQWKRARNLFFAVIAIILITGLAMFIGLLFLIFG